MSRPVKLRRQQFTPYILHPATAPHRNERLENFVVSLRRNPLIGNRLNYSVYFYRVASDVCDYVVEKDGKPV